MLNNAKSIDSIIKFNVFMIISLIRGAKVKLLLVKIYIQFVIKCILLSFSTSKYYVPISFVKMYFIIY